jgi:hypothetical protein
VFMPICIARPEMTALTLASQELRGRNLTLESMDDVS